ncbi:MAG: PucR family transcriptional regulator ligand-binding domain-containing protein [Thermaerobacter sp.]|nr:PucR family transcriptional regulator ligand-binding domain-containing protein [Thermaerobacter sp.]
MPMTVGRLLNTAILRPVTLVAGRPGLDRIVESVNMMDAPDIIEWIRPHQLLISTLYNMREDADGLEQLVPLLVERGCSALGIKAQRYFDKMPNVLIEQADTHHLPLFEIPTELALGVLSHEVTKILLRGEFPVSHGTQFATQRVVQALLTEPRVDVVAHQLSRATRGAVVIVTNDHTVWGQANHSLSADRLASLLECMPRVAGTQRSLQPDKVLIDDLPVERIPAVLNGTVYGTIVLIDPKISSPKLIESSIHALSMAKLRQHLAEERWQQWMHHTVQRLVAGGGSDDLYATSRELGLDGRVGFGVAVGRIDGQNGHRQWLGNHWFRHQSLSSDILEWTLATLKQLGWAPIGALDDDRMVILLSAGQSLGNVRNLSEEAISHFQLISERLASEYDLSLHFALGSLYSSVTHLPFSFREAQEVDAQSGADGTVHVYQSRKAKDVVKVVPPAERARFVEAVLGPLLTMPWAEREVLLRTLEGYFACEGQATDAAKALYVHRNTVLYRLRKLEEILSRSFNDPDDVLTIRLSLLFLANLQ